MQFKRLWGTMLACTVTISCLGMTAKAQDTELVHLREMAHIPLSETDLEYSSGVSVSRATSLLNTSVSANGAKALYPVISLDAGKTVTFNCSYTPTSSSMDFGLVAPDGYFYYANVIGGSINKTILIEERGTYTLAIINNSSRTVTVTGTVLY